MSKLKRTGFLILCGMVLIFTACGGGGGGDNTNYAPIEPLGGGVAKNISKFNGKEIYAIISFQPSDKRESNVGFGPEDDSNEQDWTLTTTSNVAPSFIESGSVNNQCGRDSANLAKKRVFSLKQTLLDQKMREFENNILATTVPQFSKKLSRIDAAAPATIAVGTKWSGVNIVATESVNTINTTCQYVSEHAYFFVDDRDTVAISGYLDDYAVAFDAIYEVNHAKFGTENDVDGNGKVIIVFSQELSGGLLGYFYAGDKFSSTIDGNQYSNEGDIFYMTASASYQGDIIKGTLAHEFQHMIYFDQHYNRGVIFTYTWLNEALSQAAEYYNGYTDNHLAWIESFLYHDGITDPGWMYLSLTHWTSDNYGYGALFIRYLIDQYGDNAIKKMCSTNKVGIAAVESSTGVNFNTIFNNFTRALVMSGTGDTDDPKYNFTTLDLQAVQPLGRGGLTSSIVLNAGGGGTSWSYPYEIFFIKCSGNFRTMTLGGIDVVGTAFGLSQ